MAYRFFDMVYCTTIGVERASAGGGFPPGYTFAPADDELVMFYLFNKILGRNMPLSDVIEEIELYEHDPDDLPGDKHPQDHFRYGMQHSEAYYFTNLSRGERNVIKRTTPGGYWEVTSEGEQVTYGSQEIVVGFKTSMVFNEGHDPVPEWVTEKFIMEEYRVNAGVVPVKVLDESGVREKMRNFVVCRIINMEIEARREGLAAQMPLYSDDEEDDEEEDDENDDDEDDDDEDDDDEDDYDEDDYDEDDSEEDDYMDEDEDEDEDQ